MNTYRVAADSRYRKAVEIAANAQHIVPVSGERAYLVPASEGGYYRVDADGCPCPDATYRRALCKHLIAVAILRVGTFAVEANAERRRSGTAGWPGSLPAMTSSVESSARSGRI
jgi:hypothetical protein